MRYVTLFLIGFTLAGLLPIHAEISKQDLLKLARKRASRNYSAASARGLSGVKLKSLARSRASQNITVASARGLVKESRERTGQSTANFSPNTIEYLERHVYSKETLTMFLFPVRGENRLFE
jgi:hypothetical protein